MYYLYEFNNPSFLLLLFYSKVYIKFKISVSVLFCNISLIFQIFYGLLFGPMNCDKWGMGRALLDSQQDNLLAIIYIFSPCS